MPEIINKSIVGVGFGFLHDDEIKKLSVKQITNSSTYDSLKQPVIGGLYDRAMGPTDYLDSNCETCGLDERDCPGHPGHIQLGVPCYNIFLLDQLLKLLNCKCWNCHHLRVSPLKKKSVFAQLLYLDAGLMLKAREVAQIGTGRPNPTSSAAIEANRAIEQQLDQHIERAQAALANATPIDSKLTFHISEVRSKLLKNFLTSAKAPKCSQCNAFSPSVRRDGFTKIFVQSLNSKQVAHNGKLGLKVMSVMSRGTAMYQDELFTATTPLGEDKKKKDKKDKKKVKKSKKSSKAADSSDDDDDKDDDMVKSDDEDYDEVLAEMAKAKSDASKANEDPTQITSETNVEETTSRLILPNEVERHLSLLWASNDSEFLHRFFCPGTRSNIAANPYNGNDYRSFFHRVLLVPPSRFRPPSFLNGEYFESGANISYRKIFDANEEIIRTVFTNNTAAAAAAEDDAMTDKEKSAKTAVATTANTNDLESRVDRLTPQARKRVVDAWMVMQHELNLLFDSDKTGQALAKPSGNGIKQLLEKKQGLFRKHMMGKRVNYAARSVISPDPYLHSREIGVPDIFAKTLTFPEPITSFNMLELKQAIINGPNVHPGANAIIDKQGREVSLKYMALEQRQALAEQVVAESSRAGPTTTKDDKKQDKPRQRAVTSVEKSLDSHLIGDTGPVVVLRHLKSGDVLLLNRQPTLHKPSMMAHIARVLTGEKVIRMHYSNCNTYNADFDGDEMNMHFPQNQLARIEAYDIANNDNQYIGPTSGNPLRGLIQDHVVCGVRLTQRDMFLNREYFQQFLFLAIADRDVQKGNVITTPQPTILKPRPLWTGKQLIDCILDFVAQGRPPLCLQPTKAKVPGESWGKQGKEDGLVIIRENRLVQGVLDKAMFGASKHGLVHAVYELYGAKAAGDLLTIFGRLFTRVLQYDAFTCGIEDFVLTPEIDKQRRLLIQEAQWAGVHATANCAGLEGDVATIKTFGPGKINEAVQRMYTEYRNAGELLDNAVKGQLSGNTSEIIKTCIPQGQRIPFPKNNMAMMTLSGAKGSAVNHSQIACLLGQQELEGRRVPVTMVGKSLPSFPRYDPQPRAGGYITQRFFTGLRVQEFYHHAMSGREGLVDTAVKTANSGYLQRCLIKLLEGLTVRYDHTVRDVDGSVVQFQYGEDGIDPLKAGYLSTMSFMANNFQPLMTKLNPTQALNLLDCNSVDKYREELTEKEKELKELKNHHAKMCEKDDKKIKEGKINKADKLKEIAEKRVARQKDIEQLEQAMELLRQSHVDPVLSKFPIGKTLGAVSDRFAQSVQDYIQQDPDGVFANARLMAQRWSAQIEEKQQQLEKIKQQLQGINMQKTNAKAQEQKQKLERRIESYEQWVEMLNDKLQSNITPEKFTIVMNLDYMFSLAHAGENVGVIAGQGVGEPSTQMTLNTFHLAGHGGANVTLGIPRLREIIMTASDHISTPIMELPLLNPTPQAAAQLAAKLNKVKLSECLTSIKVQQGGKANFRQDGSRAYNVQLKLKDLNDEWATSNLVTLYNITKCVCVELSRKLNTAVKDKIRHTSAGVLSSRINRSHAELMTNAEEEVGEVDNDDLLDAMDSSERKKLRQLEEGVSEVELNKKKKQQTSYDDDEEDQEEEEEEEEEEQDQDEDDSDDEEKASKLDDIDEESEDDNLMNDKPMAKAPKAAKTTTKKAKTTAAPKPNLTSQSELEQGETDAIPIESFLRKLEPYWGRYECINQIKMDKENNTIEIIVTTPPGSPKLLMLSTIERLADVCRVRFTEGINKAIVLEKKGNDGKKFKVVQTDGVNFAAVFKYPEVDHNNIKTNDIHKILNTYGCEAASASVRGEISGVFGVYGISVDPRHLSLISDFMTFEGGYKAMNRNCMTSRPSVFQKATFETSMKFILDAVQSGEYDSLTSPSSSIIVGKPIQSGSGSFELKYPLPTL